MEFPLYEKRGRIIRAARRDLRINTNTEVLRIYAYRIFPALKNGMLAQRIIRLSLISSRTRQ